MYTALWEQDRMAKCRREEIEAALQIERNKEMLKVLTLQSAAAEKQKEEMAQLKEKEAQLLVRNKFNTYMYMYVYMHENLYGL